MNETLTPSPTQSPEKVAVSATESRQRAQAWRLVDADEASLQRMQRSLLTAQAASEEALRQSNDRLATAITAGDLLLIEQIQGVIRAQGQEWQQIKRRLRTVADLQQEQKLFNRMTQRLGSEVRARWFERVIALVVLLAVVLALITLTLPLPPGVRWWIDTVDLLLAIILIAEFFFRYSHAPDERWFWRRYWLDLLASIPLQPLLRLGRLVSCGRFVRVLPLPWLDAWWQARFSVTPNQAGQRALLPPDIAPPAVTDHPAIVRSASTDAVAPTPTAATAPSAPNSFTPRQQAAHFAETATLAEAVQRLVNQRSFDAIATTAVETLMSDFGGVQAAIYWLVPRTSQLRQIQQTGAGQRFPTQVMINEGLIGAMIAQLLTKTEVANGELKPVLAPGAVVGETVMVYPLVAGNRVIGALVLVTSAELARYYEYTRMPLLLAHSTALALHAAEK